MATTFSNEHKIEFPYTRTPGPVLGPFLTGLRDGTILGGRIGDKVYCPPMEFDPETSKTVQADLVPVGPGGEVVTATWIAQPSPKHPFDEPFAFATIRLDGADTPILHAVSASDADAVTPGTRVTAQFRPERAGAITDLYFALESDAETQQIEPGEGEVRITEHFISLTVTETLFPHRQRFAQGLLDGKLIGQRSPATGQVTVPGKGYDQMARVRMSEADDVEIEPVGTVVGFTELTPIQYHGQTETEPWVRCSVLLDGCDSPLSGIDVREIGVDDFRIGMRLRGVFRPEGERDISEIDNRGGAIPEGVIDRWELTGEPDVDPSTLTKASW